MKKCENCGDEHNSSFGSGRFCSDKCAKGFSTKNKRSLINEKVKQKLHDRVILIEKECLWCKSKINVSITYKDKEQCCSRSCAAKLRASKHKELLSRVFSKSAKERYAKNDPTIGWQSRKKMKMSKPEEITKNILNKSGYAFEREFKVGKFFIDFAFIDKKIALEIDGKQHKYPERIKKDIEKDDFLKKTGWKIIRVDFLSYENLEEKENEILYKLKENE